MSLIESISRGAFGVRADVSGTPAPWDDYWYNPLGDASSTGMRITEESAKRIATVLACVGVIGRNLGMMPIKIYTEAPDGSKKLVDHHPLYDVLYSRPNDQQTAFEFKQQMQGHLELRGNAYAEIIPGPRGAVDQLVPMDPDSVKVEILKPSGRIRYAYNDPLTGNTRNLVQEEVFHLRNFPRNMYTGQSTIGMACDTFGIALAQQDYSARFLKNDARPPLVIEGAGDGKTKIDRDRARESWQEGQTGANRGKTAVLPSGWTVKTIGVTPADQQLLDARKFSRIEVCSIFGVPPHLIGETEKTATYASVEQFNIMYAVHCILPRLVLWEQAISRDLLTSSKYFAKFSMAALLRGDTASRFAAYQVAIQNGWMSQDDVRLLEDLNPIPDGVGKTYWRNAAWVPLGQIEAPAAADPENTDDDDPQADEQGDEGQGDNAPAAATARLRLEALADSAADRCARREAAGFRKLVERGASDYQLEEFRQEQLKFVGEVLRLDSAQMAEVAQALSSLCGQVDIQIQRGDKAAAFALIEFRAAENRRLLARLATGRN